MGLQKRSKSLSSLSRKLLAQGESEHADFKRAPEGISTEDIVAFANSDAGGQILVGVDEQNAGEAQIGIVRGCDVSDLAILQILNKAVSCIPPIAVDIFIENLSAKAILRIAVPSSATKPHCTPKGVYCRRDGSRNRPLHPSELLRIFLETEARAFAERFEAAAERITEDIGNLEGSLESSIKNMADQLGWADYKLGDTEDKLDALLGRVVLLGTETSDSATRLRSLFRQDKREDPVRDREFKKFVKELIDEILSKKGLVKAVLDGQSLSITASGIAALELTKEDVQSAFDEAAKTIVEIEDRKNYAVECKNPSKFNENQLDRFAEVVAEGGEIADGVRERIGSAHTLGYITYKGAIVGTAALKKPPLTYRKKIFSNAKSTSNPTEFPFELGWIFLKPEHRRKGQMTRLLQELMPLAKEKSMFSTTRSTNELMQEMLSQMKFKSDGEAYASTQQPGTTLQLFLRP